jgi:hypothetical protein
VLTISCFDRPLHCARFARHLPRARFARTQDLARDSGSLHRGPLRSLDAHRTGLHQRRRGHRLQGVRPASGPARLRVHGCSHICAWLRR